MDTILIQVKEKLNSMRQILSLPRFIGPLITIICIALNQQLIQLGLFPPQVAWLYLPVAFAASMGLRPGLLSALMVAVYSILIDPTSIQRVIIVPFSIFALAGLIGWQTRALRKSIADEITQHIRADSNQEKANIVDTLNGNITRVTEAREQILIILQSDILTDKTREKLRSVLHTLNNLEQATKGWIELRELKEKLK